jgi:serine/threonine protein phosphatase PrpC
MRKQIDTLHSGSTMVFAAHDLRSGKVFFGYIGDSRAVFQQSPEAPHIATPDHKPSSQAETMRIRILGGYVSYNKNDVPRVNGNLATSRSFGDGSLKHNSEDRSQDLVSVTPDIMGPYNFGPDSIYFLGSDGLFDEVQNAELVKFVRNGGEAANVGSHFCSLAKQRGSRDDISIGFAFGV